MDFQDLLNHADYNVAETKNTGGVKRYSCVLPPPKKVPKANVQSESIKKFLEKKKAEEAAKAIEAQKQKEKLLALRAQNSKNNKKAKIMASRTKDNDFSRIKLTDDEIEAKKKREAVLIKKNLADKVERMKARIEMEEKEKLLPKKRKRKSKNLEVDGMEEYPEVQNGHTESSNNMKRSEDNKSHKNSHKPPSLPSVSFNDLLKIAEKKQFQPVEIAVKKKEEVKLMTKKERKLLEEEKARERRKQERLKEKIMEKHLGRSTKSNSVQSNKKNISECVENNKQPVVIHVGKDVSKVEQDSMKFKIPKGTGQVSINKNIPIKQKEVNSNSVSKCNANSISEKSSKSASMIEQKTLSKIKPGNPSIKDTEIRQKVPVPKKNGLKINPVQRTSNKTPELDKEALRAVLEKEIREKLENELEAKIAAKFAQFQNIQSNQASEKASEVPKQIKKEPGVGNAVVKKTVEKPMINSRKDIERLIAMKKQQAMQQRSMKPKLPEKKPFHKNPYLDPPRRLLEPQRPPRPPMPRRFIESDDEDEDDDDDMSSFIDDSQNEENYSEYIKEIFNYDRSRYQDEDDDDVMETSFAEQMKEEVRSARLGYLEDLEEEKAELARKRKKKLKK